MSLDASLTDLMDRLVSWSKFPKYQLERRVDIFQNRELRSDERRLRVEAAANPGREERREKVADTRAALASGAPAVFEAPDQLRRMTKALEGGVPPPVPASSCDVPYPCPFERRCAAERCP